MKEKMVFHFIFNNKKKNETNSSPANLFLEKKEKKLFYSYSMASAQSI